MNKLQRVSIVTNITLVIVNTVIVIWFSLSMVLSLQLVNFSLNCEVNNSLPIHDNLQRNGKLKPQITAVHKAS